MKIFTALLLILVLMLFIVGCNTPYSKDNAGETIEVYGYVQKVESNSFAAHINDIGYVNIKYPNAKKKIKLFDTVIIEYYETDLIENKKTFTDVSGERTGYSYKITHPKSVRVADLAKGEPVFG